MSSDLEKAPAYAFGTYHFETQPYRLRNNGDPRDLTPQQAQLLELLIEKAGEIVSREQIRSCLWPPDVHVDFDRGINFCVTRLRAALDDRGSRSRIIETVPRRGYRFVSAVAVSSACEAIVAPPPASTRQPIVAPIALALVLLVAFLIWMLSLTHT